jgi:hypothetical protein
VQVTIDSRDSVEHALRVVGSLYGVELAVASSSDEAAPSVTPTSSTAARRGTKKAAGGDRRAQRSQRSSAPASTDLAAVRAWARDSGYQVSDRGRVSNTVLDAYMQRTSGG